MQVTVIDYGAGNLRSVANALYLAGAEPEVAATPEAVSGAGRIVLPGVGAAGHAIARLRASGMADALDAARTKGTPILGICLGLQLMAERLDEFGSHAGLGWIPGRVGPIEEAVTVSCRVPHTGWSAIATTERAEGLIREHHAPPKSVAGLVALDHAHLVRGVLLLHQEGEIEAGRSAAEAGDAHRESLVLGPSSGVRGRLRRAPAARLRVRPSSPEAQAKPPEGQ